MMAERANYFKDLPAEEIIQTEEIKAVEKYVDRLQNEGGATLEVAKVFAAAMLNWYLHIEELIIEAINRSKK
jgi:hypothetical protein